MQIILDEPSDHLAVRVIFAVEYNVWSEPAHTSLTFAGLGSFARSLAASITGRLFHALEQLG